MSEQVCTHMKDLREDCQMCGRAVEHLRASSDTRQHRSQADRDDLAAILDAHEFIPAYHGALSGRCKACHPPELDNMMGTNVHCAHVAQAVLQSDWLSGVRAKERGDQ